MNSKRRDVWGEHSELFYNGLTKQTSRMEIFDKQSFQRFLPNYFKLNTYWILKYFGREISKKNAYPCSQIIVLPCGNTSFNIFGLKSVRHDSRTWLWRWRLSIIFTKLSVHKFGKQDSQFLVNWNNLKELYTSESTMTQKIVLTPLNNEFELRIWISTSFMLNNPPILLKKIYKNQFLASWRGLMVFMYINKVFDFYLWILFKNSGGFFSMKEVEYNFF